jgi:tetratricopeptide (TPR) repeat protein
MTDGGRKWLWVLALMGLMAGLARVRAQELAPDAAMQLLEQGRTSYDEQTLGAASDAYARLTQEHPNNAQYWYERALANSYRSLAYEAHGDKKKAGHVLDEAIGDVQQSLTIDDNSADAHSLLADLYGRKIGFGMPMFAGPKYGPKVDQENQRALRIDESNPRVYASLGRQYLEAPKMFGGDLDKAVENFRKSTQLDPKNAETFVWLAIALRKKGDAAGAQQALNEALRLNPASAFAKETAAAKK